MIWVALEEPRWAIPDVPELEDPAWVNVHCGPYWWACDASRQVENFTDFGHFPFVHPGLLGDPERPVVPGHEVRTDGHVLHYEIVRPEAPANEEFPVFGNEVVESPERRSRYELHLPYTIVLRLGWGGQAGMVYFFACRPEGPDRTTGFLAIGRNYNLEQPDSVLQEFEDVIFEQDRRIVESQRPERVPFDLADELHLTFDAVAVAYRRAMRANGLALGGKGRTGPAPTANVITLRIPSWASISSKPWLTSSRLIRCESRASTSISPASQRSTSSGTCVRPLTPPNDDPVTRRPVIRNRGTTSSVSPLPATPHIVARPQASRADSTACRITETSPVASKV